MNGGHVKEHHFLQLTPDEGGALRSILEDVRDIFKAGKIGLTELQDETAEHIVRVLEMNDGEEANVGA